MNVAVLCVRKWLSDRKEFHDFCLLSSADIRRCALPAQISIRKLFVIFTLPRACFYFAFFRFLVVTDNDEKQKKKTFRFLPRNFRRRKMFGLSSVLFQSRRWIFLKLTDCCLIKIFQTRSKFNRGTTIAGEKCHWLQTRKSNSLKTHVRHAGRHNFHPNERKIRKSSKYSTHKTRFKSRQRTRYTCQRYTYKLEHVLLF